MAIRDVIGAALALKEAYDQLESLQASKAAIVAQRDAVQAQIDATQIVVDERKAALKAAAATL
jgi:chaperonin cofactor prefoldin